MDQASSVRPELDSLATYESCPAGCDFTTRLRCWQRLARELLADLSSATASGSPDAEVVRADLRAAQRQIALLTDLVRRAA